MKKLRLLAESGKPEWELAYSTEEPVHFALQDGSMFTLEPEGIEDRLIDMFDKIMFEAKGMLAVLDEDGTERVLHSYGHTYTPVGDPEYCQWCTLDLAEHMD